MKCGVRRAKFRSGLNRFSFSLADGFFLVIIVWLKREAVRYSGRASVIACGATLQKGNLFYYCPEKRYAVTSVPIFLPLVNRTIAHTYSRVTG